MPNGLWQFFSEYEPLLRNQICIMFHHYLPWFTSEYHLRIMFDHSYCQNVHSQSQNSCFKEFANQQKNMPQSVRLLEGGINAIPQNAILTFIILKVVVPSEMLLQTILMIWHHFVFSQGPPSHPPTHPLISQSLAHIFMPLPAWNRGMACGTVEGKKVVFFLQKNSP